MAKSKKGYHTIGVMFEVDERDDYNEPEISLHITGKRFETDLERSVRQEKDKETLAKRKLWDKETKERRKREQEQRDTNERAYYEKLKEKFEREDNFKKYMELVGEEAASRLRKYSPSYLKSWFWRNQPKLNGLTAEDLIKSGDVETVRKLALKQL